MNSIVVHGIPNCDTVKRARAWLAARGAAVRFHDFRKDGLPEADLQRWLDAAGWQKLLNRAGTSWRRIDESRRAAVVDRDSAAALMREQPTVIKRPVVHWPDGTITVGFDADDWTRRLPG